MLIIICGAPSSGKSTYAKNKYPTYTHLSKEDYSSIKNLLKEADNHENLTIEGLMNTKENRQVFIDYANKRKILYEVIQLSIDKNNAIINFLHREYIHQSKLGLSKENEHPDYQGNWVSLKKEKYVFPVCVFNTYYKYLENEKTQVKAYIETFSNYTNKAVFFDCDGVLRTTKNDMYYPTSKDDQIMNKNYIKIINDYKKQNYKIIAITNQSGIYSNKLTEKTCIELLEELKKYFSLDDYGYCPHSYIPTCYCRKPNPGMGVYFIEKYKLNPKLCIYYGDLETDRKFAQNLNFSFIKVEK